ncbi:DUF6883 domain-containing protein [Tautonia marina]|uniref:DUF6883 domain-containing protein n=1 Tax=Tautonia marina TaxID=2653855 RepID=UPI0012607F73|nr:DUF6883 domain-containing protein [Tautonia marina]
MKIPEDAIIADDKLTKYLLIHRPEDDKSKFLGLAGFDVSCADSLRDELRALAARVDAVEDGVNSQGTYYLVRGAITGPNGRSLKVVTVWIHLQADGSYRFVTLKPDKSRQP